MCVLMATCAGASATPAPPQLYRQPAYQSPVNGEPGSLLLLAGYGFAIDDTVVYREVRDSRQAQAAPNHAPGTSTAEFGVAPVVSAGDVPYALTIKLPEILRPGRTYALWVLTAHGGWSMPVLINDARPLWVSPSFVYASRMPGFLPRALKIVGRNLAPIPGLRTRIRIDGPRRYESLVTVDPDASATFSEYVAWTLLPARIEPGKYRVEVNRDGKSWVGLAGQLLDVLPDPQAAPEFSVGEPRFGSCQPNDGADDTACIVRAIDAAKRAGGGVVVFGPGTWDLIDVGQSQSGPPEGIIVATGVQLRGAGDALTRLRRHAEWNAHEPTAAFTLLGHTVVSNFSFVDLQVYEPTDRAAPFLQLGMDDRRFAADLGSRSSPAVVEDVVIAHNIFDKPLVAIGSGGLPLGRLFITYNTFGAYHSALELTGNKYNMSQKFRIDDSVINNNTFKPGSELDLIRKTGAIVSELGAGYRLDFSGNTADGSSTEYLNAPTDAKGWRAAYFWNMNNNIEEMLVSQNTATCTADKIGDGEAIAYDNNTNTFAFAGIADVVASGSDSAAVAVTLAARQNLRTVPANYYVGHWVQIASGPGLGQARKIVGYSTDGITHVTTFKVAPAWDVAPIPGRTRIAVGREFWQLLTLDNRVDGRQPLCQKSNRSRRTGGQIGMWAQSTDSVIAGNRQYDTDGIFVQQSYDSPEHPCADCTMASFFNNFLQIRGNVVDGEYDWSIDCSSSGIAMGAAAAPWRDEVPPTVGFGNSLSHNVIRHADGQRGGAISQIDSWFSGPAPHRWPLSENLLIQQNMIENISGARAVPVCATSRPRTGIAFPDTPIAWHTVLYGNTCKNVTLPIGPGGVQTIAVCPASAANSCECPQTGR